MGPAIYNITNDIFFALRSIVLKNRTHSRNIKYIPRKLRRRGRGGQAAPALDRHRHGPLLRAYWGLDDDDFAYSLPSLSDSIFIARLAAQRDAADCPATRLRGPSRGSPGALLLRLGSVLARREANAHLDAGQSFAMPFAEASQAVSKIPDRGRPR